MTAPKTAPPTKTHAAPIPLPSAEQQTTPPAILLAETNSVPPVGSTTTPPTMVAPTPKALASAGSTSHPAAARGASSPKCGTPRPDDPTTPPTREQSLPNQETSAGATATQQAKMPPTPMTTSPAGSQTTPPTTERSTPLVTTSAGPIRRPAAARVDASPKGAAPRLADRMEPSPSLGLALLAGVVDDLEATRTAAENRVRQLLRDEDDSDGVNRGFGLTEGHPQVMALIAIRDGIKANEHMAILELQRAMRKHPLGPWLKAQRGIGEKQGARLLAAIGDPYWNTLHNRPRTVSELWAYCGLHVLPASHLYSDTQASCAGGAQTPVGQLGLDTQSPDADRTQSPASQAVRDTQVSAAGGASFPVGHRSVDTHVTPADRTQSPASQLVPDAQVPRAGGVSHPVGQWRSDAQSLGADRSRTGDTGSQMGSESQGTAAAGVAAKRRKGQRVNWSTEAKTRAYLIAESCMKQPAGTPYRDIYEWGRKKYADAVHPTPCARCGPAGRPAPVGSPLSAGHQHARALRLVAKDGVLKELWREAKRIHEGGE